MRREIPSPLALTLLILMRRQGWYQNDLAAALGVSASTMSVWIGTGAGLDRDRVDQIAAQVLRVSPQEVERVLRFLNGHEPDLAPPGLEALAPWERRTVHEARDSLVAMAGPLSESEYGQIALEIQIHRARAEAEACWKQLQAATPDHRVFLLRSVRAFQTPAFCVRVCTESRAAAPKDASRALTLANLALYVAQHVPGDVNPRCQAYAWAFIANAHRVSGKLPKANTAFARALDLWANGKVGDPFLSEARFLDLEASLRRDQRRIDEALDLLERALALADPSEKGGLLIKKGTVLHACDQFEEASKAFRSAETWIDQANDPRSWLVVQFNLTSCLCGLGKFKEAEALFKNVCELGFQLDQDLDLLRIRWLGAKVKAGLGGEEEAAQTFNVLRNEYASQENPFDSAMVSLDLAELYLRQERWSDVQILAEEMIQIFRSLGVQREPLAALLLFQEAVQRQQATIDLVRRLARYLEDARRDPSHRFSG
jgi:tetratricopeptide (TPR) repeat protein